MRKNPVVLANDYVDMYPGLDLGEIARRLHDDKCIPMPDIKIDMPCVVCGALVRVRPSTYRKQKRFKCDDHIKRHPQEWKDRLKRRVQVTCAQCGKLFEVVPSDIKPNQYNDAHSFCSRECYAKFRSAYYVNEKHPLFHHKMSDHVKEKLREARADVLRNSDRINSKIQLSVNAMLDSLGIEYIREYQIEYYNCDLFLVGMNQIIEVMGDYWHGNPLKYNYDKYPLNSIQSRTIHKDKEKKSYISHHTESNILYLWETDINKRPDVCLALIIQFIADPDGLSNYHSFNYSIIDGSLTLNQDLITPYQDIPHKDFKDLVK